MHPLITTSGFHAIMLYVSMAICFGPEWVGSFFQRSEAGAVKRDRGSHVFLVVMVVFGIFVAFFCANAFPQATLAWNPPLQFWAGIALMFCGLALRWYAIRVLGKFFTRDVATRAEQYVVETGPYRLVRHPSYSGALLMFLGTGIAMTNWSSLLAITLGAAFGYGWRVHVEEHALCADLGDAYRDYMRRTRRFIPFVW